MELFRNRIHNYQWRDDSKYHYQFFEQCIFRKSDCIWSGSLREWSSFSKLCDCSKSSSCRARDHHWFIYCLSGTSRGSIFSGDYNKCNNLSLELYRYWRKHLRHLTNSEYQFLQYRNFRKFDCQGSKFVRAGSIVGKLPCECDQ